MQYIISLSLCVSLSLISLSLTSRIYWRIYFIDIFVFWGAMMLYPSSSRAWLLAGSLWRCDVGSGRSADTSIVDTEAISMFPSNFNCCYLLKVKAQHTKYITNDTWSYYKKAATINLWNEICNAFPWISNSVVLSIQKVVLSYCNL